MLGETVQQDQGMVHALAHVCDVECSSASAHVPVGPRTLELDRAGGDEGVHLRFRSFAAFLRAPLE